MSARLCALLLAALLTLPVIAQGGAAERHFEFHYGFTVHNLHQGSALRIWMPIAQSDAFQSVHVVWKTGDLPLRETRESTYGNAMFYAEAGNAGKDEYSFEIVYDVVRRQAESRNPGVLHAAIRQRLTAADKLVPITGLPAQLAAKQVASVSGGDYAKARAIYDYVLANMRYDKTGTGWGHGDTLYACNAKHGNCTDFHSLFISMVRSQNIPAQFAIGFSVPTDKHSGEIPGYHCWADFYAKDHGWVPVDISEAWKHPEQREFFFGHWDDDRVQFSVGRDIVLTPKQNGAPLNYFVYPYAESAGEEVTNISTHFSFEDVGGPQRVVLGAQ